MQLGHQSFFIAETIVHSLCNIRKYPLKALLEFKVCQREVLESTVKRIDEIGFEINSFCRF